MNLSSQEFSFYSAYHKTSRIGYFYFTVTSNPAKINCTFKTFYQKLYDSEVNYYSKTYNGFLSSLHLPELLLEATDSLVQSIMLEELTKAIESMNIGKSPDLL